MLVKELELVNSQEEAKVRALASFTAPGAATFATGCSGASWMRWLREPLLADLRGERAFGRSREYQWWRFRG